MDGIQQQPISQTPIDSNSSSGKPKSSIIIIFIILLILIVGGIYLFHKRSEVTPTTVVKQTIQNTPSPTSSLQPTPIISPVTSANVNQTLTNTNSSVQKTINQANADINSINSIDKSQDSTTGL